MVKRVICIFVGVFMLCCLLTIPSLAAEKLPVADGMERPAHIAYYTGQANGQMYVRAYYAVPDEILEIVSKNFDSFREAYDLYEYNAFLQTDWSLDSENGWHYTAEWDRNVNPQPTCDKIQKDMISQTEIFWLTYEEDRNLLGDAAKRDSNNSWYIDFDSHKLYLRTRFIIEVKGNDGSTQHHVSDWSDVALINDVHNRKDKYSTFDFSKLDAPVIYGEQVKLDEDDNNRPYLSFMIQYPDSLKQAALAMRKLEKREMSLTVQRRVNGGEWEKSRITNNDFPYSYGERTIYIDSDILASDAYAEYRLKLEFSGSETIPKFETPWSETLKYNIPSWSDVSTWAEPWLEKAEDYNLIPDVLVGANMTQPITRHEFAALSVKLYEAMTKKAAVAGENPFTDTNDAEILKAVNIGVTNGTAKDKFSPDALITREQAATMLTRAYKAAFWEGWTLATDGSYAAHKLDYSGVPAFDDDQDISSWAKPSVYFMVKNNIINGVGNNRFAPNTANIPANAAVNYGQATREVAIKIAVASYENLK